VTPPYDVVDVDDEFRPSEFPGVDPEPGAEAQDANALPLPIWALEAPDPQPIEWVVRDLFTAGDIGLIVGDGGSFKSSAAIHIAAAVAGGYKAFDRFDTMHGPALVCSAEDPGSVIQMRLEAFVRGQDWDRHRVLSNFHYFALAGMRLKDAKWKRHLELVIHDLCPSIVVLDPFVDLSGLEEENSNSEASTVMSFTRELARNARAATVFVHHGNKSSEGRTQSRIRGATTIANASRGTLFFEFTDAGVLVEQLKMTYAEKVSPFMLTRDIASEPTNRAVWISARLATAKPAEVRLTKAQEFVINQLSASPRQLGTRDLKRAAEGTSHRGTDIQDAVNRLFIQDRIAFEKGPRAAKLWYVVGRGNEPVSDCAGTVEKTSVPTVPDGLVHTQNGPRVTVPPLKGGTHSHAANGPEPDETQTEGWDFESEPIGVEDFER
jgi:hypothetical protein